MSYICLNCIDDKYLKRDVSEETEQQCCDFCGGSASPSISLEKLAVIVDGPIQDYCDQGPNELTFDLEHERSDYVQRGISLVDLLQEELGIDYDPAVQLADALINNDPADIRDGDEPFYTEDANYERRYLTSWPYSETWETLSGRIKHKRRFFDDESRNKISEILGEKESDKAKQLPVIELGPGKRVQHFYRSRRAESLEKAKQILGDLIQELGPVPSAQATAGRMNPSGISVFYGAISEKTAVAEVRPFVGSLVIVGQFYPSRPLRLLDLTRIGVGFAGSIFDPGYADRASYLAFLQDFHSLIARPIQPQDEPLEYIPTQAVAEYVANVLHFDGILYGSAQLGTVPGDSDDVDPYVEMHELTSEELGNYNLVLFNEAAVVKKPTATGEDTDFTIGLLKFREGSEKTVRVSSVEYNYDDEFVLDPGHEPSPPF